MVFGPLLIACWSDRERFKRNWVGSTNASQKSKSALQDSQAAPNSLKYELDADMICRMCTSVSPRIQTHHTVPKWRPASKAGGSTRPSAPRQKRPGKTPTEHWSGHPSGTQKITVLQKINVLHKIVFLYVILYIGMHFDDRLTEPQMRRYAHTLPRGQQWLSILMIFTYKTNQPTKTQTSKLTN